MKDKGHPDKQELQSLLVCSSHVVVIGCCQISLSSGCSVQGLEFLLMSSELVSFTCAEDFVS